jgi:hypothetical protein
MSQFGIWKEKIGGERVGSWGCLVLTLRSAIHAEIRVRELDPRAVGLDVPLLVRFACEGLTISMSKAISSLILRLRVDFGRRQYIHD